MTRARLGALALVCAGPLLVLARWAEAQDVGSGLERQAIVVYVPGASFEELLGVPEIADLARSGGAALMSSPVPVNLLVRAEIPDSKATPLPCRCPRVPLGTFVRLPDSAISFDELGAQVGELVRLAQADDTLVIVVGTERSSSMRGDKDELLPIVLARGDPDGLLSEDGPLRTLTSDSTRRTGVVVGADVPTTLARFLGLPGAEGGSEIRSIDEPPPLEGHERYLAQRRMYVPVGTAAALYAAVAGILGVVAVARWDRVPARWRRIAGWATLSIPMLATGMLAVGHLPDLSYATAVPMIAIVTVFGTLAFSPLVQRDATLVPAGIGLAVLAFLGLEAVLGWSGMLTPLLGGSQLDGGRFYGLPNVAIGLLVGSGLWVAQRLRTLAGFALLCGLGLFAGLPLVGSNLGGAVTAFAAAGAWLAVRERDRLGRWWGLAACLGVTALGTVVILIAHALSPVETHIARFEENAGGIAGVLEKYADRLRVGFDLIARSPAALIPVIGLPVVLVVVLRPPGPIRDSFERRPAWRDAVLVTIVAGMVAYVANDSGPAAAGLAFGMGLGGMLGVSLLAPAGKMVGR